ncbi:hypothetical protein HB779_20975 (plasmid) [Phyllobacterium sp. 628]|uniref:hypothetical protein n=1 Tax=Phyllobacterium sp. 628 TaxID=2718938 RepID=UPI0016622A11|nr:hypothetical protein [Phyllobacterium sp. 628]QND54398.1 hypothetical protein HB779_20975 [Phyllobacterium sp. 628]
MEDFLWVLALVGGPVVLGAVIALAMQVRGVNSSRVQMHNSMRSEEPADRLTELETKDSFHANETR